jgi:hypothetical protein
VNRDYAEPALDDWNPVADALATPMHHRFLPATVEQQLPAVQPVEPAVVPAGRPHDPWPARLVSAGAFVGLSGGGVWLAGQGVRDAGPYLWALAAALGSLAALIALIKSRGAGGTGGTTITVERSHHVRIGR